MSSHLPSANGVIAASPSSDASKPAPTSADRSAGGSSGDDGGAKELPKPPPAAKVIKRYSNRKLYDTARSRYVTLDEIARMVKAGEDVCIIDNESKEDLTSVTLTQIIYEEEKATRRMPLGMLRGIIQTSNSLLDKSVATARESLSVNELKLGALSFKESAARQLNELTESARRFFNKEEDRAEDFKRSVWMYVDQLDARLAERIHQVRATRSALEQHASYQGPGGESVDRVLEENTHTLEHVDALRTRLAAMSILVDRLEQAARGQVQPDEDD